VRQGYVVYLPRLKVLKHLRCQVMRLEPMFPRYLFFRQGHVDQSIAPVRSTQGVASIVAFGGNPAILGDQSLEQIRFFEERQNAADMLELSSLSPGRSVVITRGPLAGLQGLVAMVSRQRVIVLMSLLGQETRVRLNHGELKLAA
jgi:transcriptional antiterminator RfaH